MDSRGRSTAIWRNRVEAAGLRLSVAQNKLRAIQDDLQTGKSASVECLLDYQAGLHTEIEALREYARVLRIYRDLLFRALLFHEIHRSSSED
jgi:hypothetical protein